MKKGGYIRKKPKSQEKIASDRKVFEDMWVFFMEIWRERPHVSEISGEPLGHAPKSWMFEHLLEKSKYPELSKVKRNIILCTFAEHEVKSMGNPLPKHRQLIERAKKELLKKQYE